VTLTGLVFGFVIALALEKSVLERLEHLTKKAEAIGADTDFNGRVTINGTDEISSLGKNINSMLDALSLTHKEINEKHAEVQLILNTVPAALISLNENLRINPEYSKSAITMFGKEDLRGLLFSDLLALTPDNSGLADKLNEFLGYFRDELLPEADMGALNPFQILEYHNGNLALWLQLRYYLIRRDSSKNHILAVVENITEEKKLSDEVAKSQRENLQLRAIIDNPELFMEFLVETRNIIQETSKTFSLIDSCDNWKNPIYEMFRGVHTIKGVSGCFGLFGLSAICSSLEDELSRICGELFLTPHRRDNVEKGLQQLILTFNDAYENAKKVIGDDLEKQLGHQLKIPLSTIKLHVNELQCTSTTSNPELVSFYKDVINRLKALMLVPAKKGFARALKIIPGLKERLGKKVEFIFDGEDTLVDCDMANELTTPIIHLLRNAFDHGIEYCEDRKKAGKTDVAKIMFIVKSLPDKLQVIVSDNGKGMDTDALKLRALAKKFISQTEFDSMDRNAALQIIFKPGFTTKDMISDVSGRGVGMDAVYTIVTQKLKGSIDIHSELGKGSVFTIIIPQNI
jgi:HPt (histidine-containing phosphotransfer) domain-containing protein/HAMP domain-containing protein